MAEESQAKQAWRSVLDNSTSQPSPIARGAIRIPSTTSPSMSPSPKPCRTPLHDAARMGMTDVVSAMIDDGADVNALDEGGLTPLHDAAQAGHTKVRRERERAHARRKTDDTRTIVEAHEQRVGNVRSQVVQLLISRGANVLLPDQQGRSISQSARTPVIAEMLTTAYRKALRQQQQKSRSSLATSQADLSVSRGSPPIQIDKSSGTQGSSTSSSTSSSLLATSLVMHSPSSLPMPRAPSALASTTITTPTTATTTTTTAVTPTTAASAAATRSPSSDLFSDSPPSSRYLSALGSDHEGDEDDDEDDSRYFSLT